MNDVNDVDARKGKGNIVIGVMLVLTGLAIMLDRAGVCASERTSGRCGRSSSAASGWPGSFSRSPGEPKQGLLFLTAARGSSSARPGWVSLARFVADRGHRPRPHRRVQRRHDGGGGGTLRTAARVAGDPAHPRLHASDGRRRPDRSAVTTGRARDLDRDRRGLQVSGIAHRSADQTTSSDRARVVSVMGRSEHTSRATAFHGADVTNVMGRSELDLREATVAPGGEAPTCTCSRRWAPSSCACRRRGRSTPARYRRSAQVRDDRVPRYPRRRPTAGAGAAARASRAGHVRSSHHHLITRSARCRWTTRTSDAAADDAAARSSAWRLRSSAWCWCSTA